jgi:hypothetical protein
MKDVIIGFITHYEFQFFNQIWVNILNERIRVNLRLHLLKT